MNTAGRSCRGGRPHRLAGAAHDARPERRGADRDRAGRTRVLAQHLASGHVAHVQLNDRNRRGPGQGDDRGGAGAAGAARRRLRRLDGGGALRLLSRAARLRRRQRGLRARRPGRRLHERPRELRLRSVELFERPVTLRLPFRFGAATVTHCPQAFVRVEAAIGGRTVVGATAELMVPKWFDKSPALTHEQNFEQLREALRLARDAYLSADADSRRGRCRSMPAKPESPAASPSACRAWPRSSVPPSSTRRWRTPRCAPPACRGRAACRPACSATRGARRSTCASPATSPCATPSAWPTG